VKGNHTLRNLARSVNLTSGDSYYFFGKLLEGDAETDVTFNQVVLADAAVLLSAFNSCQGDPGFVANADLDEDGCVMLSDLGLLAGNFGKEGDIAITAMDSLPATSEMRNGSALIAFNAEEMVIAVEEIVTLTLDVDPRGEFINGAMVHLSFDPASVEVLGVTLTDQLPLILEDPVVDNQQGVVRFGIGLLGQTVTDRLTLATLSLKVKATTPETAITFSQGFPATSVSGPGGRVLDQAKGITLRTEAQEPTESIVDQPLVLTGRLTKSGSSRDFRRDAGLPIRLLEPQR
jgi:hypothetical protein